MICSWPAGRSMSSPASSCWWWEGWNKIGPIGRIGRTQQSLVFTLQQGNATQTISVKMDQVLTSELAARTFGQVATSQLEDVVRRGRGGRTGGHGLCPALPRDGPDLFAA